LAATVYAKHLRRHTLADLVAPQSYDGDSGLYYLKDGHLGFGFVSPPLSGADESATRRLNVLLSFDFPPGSFIQVMMWGSPDIRETMEAILDRRQRVDPALTESVNNRVKLFWRASREQANPHLNAYVREFQVVVSVKIPLAKRDGQATEKDWQTARDLRLSCEQTLKSVGLSPRPLDPERYLRIVGSMLHWGPGAGWRDARPVYDPREPVNEQAGESDDMMEVGPDGIWLGGKRLRILSPARLPDQMALWDMRRMVGDPMNGKRGIHGNFYINLNILITDSSAERMRAENSRNVINYQAFGPMLKFVPKLALKKESADVLMEAVQDGDRIVKACLSIGLFTDSLEESEARLSEAVTYLREVGWTMREDRYIALPMLANALPFCADPDAVPFLQRYKTLASRQAVEFFPVVGDWGGTGTPTLVFRSRAGQPQPVDFFDSNTNYNTCIVAASGSGKSFLTNDIITSYISTGAQCWVIDVGRSYQKLCDAIGGDFVQFGEDSRIGLNPFPIVSNYNEEADMLVGIVVSMAAMSEKLSDLQYARLRAALKELWDVHAQATTVDLVAEKLVADGDLRVRDMGHQLYAFTSKGEYGHYFNGPNTVKFDNPLTVLELEELKGRTHLQQVVLLILIYQIQQAMYLGNRDRQKLLFIDEAWDLLAKGDIGKFIETGYRRFRKYNGAAFTITQSLNDLYATPSGVSIAENSANLALLYQKPETLESVRRQNRLVIGDAAYQFLGSVATVTGAYSEIFFITSYGMGVSRLVVDEYTKLLYSTHPDDIKAIMRRVDRGMTVAEAIGDVLAGGE
jgi:conjugal transfer ATP-binding protein TraC